MLTSLRRESVADGITVSASNLPVECRYFGGDKIWATRFEEMVQGRRVLSVEEHFKDWVLIPKTMVAPEWCAKYINEHDLAHVQSNHAAFKIVTAAASVRLNVGTNYQGNGELDWDGRVPPDLEFWQMDLGIDGLVLDHESLTGLLGETARPVLDQDGNKIMMGLEAFRCSVEHYRVDGPLGTDFALLH